MLTQAALHRGHFLEWMLERPDVAPVWDRFVNHPFVMAMGNGSLPLESFKGYLIQDYLYLVGIFHLLLTLQAVIRWT